MSRPNVSTYCPIGETFKELWRHPGASRCLLDTRIFSAVSLIFLLFVVVLHISFTRKATRFNHYTVANSFLYRLQVWAIIIMPFIQVIILVFSLLTFPDPALPPGNIPLVVAERIIVWPIVCLIILREQNDVQTTKTSKKHNLGLPLLFIWSFISINLVLVNISSISSFFRLRKSEHVINFILYWIQYILTAIIFIAVFFAPGIPNTSAQKFKKLLEKRRASYTASTEDLLDRHDRKRSVVETTRGWTSNLRMLLPFIWPSNNIPLQLCLLLCLVLFVLGRIANTYVPIYSKYIVDSLIPHKKIINFNGTNNSTTTTLNSSNNNTLNSNNGTQTNGFQVSVMIPPTFRWDLILIFVTLKVCQGGVAGSGGLITTLTTLLWQKVQQFTSKELQVQFFEHLHSLSIRWHMQRKTGAVLRSMDRGSESFNNILNYILFNIIPTIVDITVAIIYFTAVFSGWIGFTVFATILVYLVVTFCMTEWRTKVNRARNRADNAKEQFAVDTLLNFETIKDCANEEHEKDKFSILVTEYQKQDWYFNLSSSLNDLVQLIVVNSGLLVGSLLVVKSIVYHEEGLTPGDYVLFMNYLTQLFEPLNNFGKSYKGLQKSFVDMENMFDILKEEVEIKDAPGASDLQIKGGQVEFRDVTFDYTPGRNVLKGVSFKIPPGKSLALVGPSGAGKTSITRLLLRFYDPTGGKILIDGQNIKEITQRSLRKSIAIVPQDTCLFNDTLRYNIKYGRLLSSDGEMFEAASVACIDKRIMTFPIGYDTMVGERGLKLSGGEKQRVSIARAVLKNPAVILLDEATSSLDTNTERQIQSSLQLLCQNRTSIIVAHRLSTIVNSDQIVVLKDGKVYERGTHDELITKGDLYASMWNQQLKMVDDKKSIEETADETEKEIKKD